jgi:glutamate synthase (NADPH/NADH) large chain
MKETNEGLYVPQLEKDSCGTGLMANLNGIKSHELVEDALTMLANMEHRGACGCEPNTGDGAGIIIQTPHEFFKKKCRELKIDLPDFGKYGVGMVFFPMDRAQRQECRVLFQDYIDECGFELIGWRKVPTDHELLGESAVASEPRVEQVFVKPKQEMELQTLERRLYILRKFVIHNIYKVFPHVKESFYIASFSYKTVVYKGQLTTYQLRPYFLDLQDADLKSAIALIHSRFSTNTVPKWKLAQPFRYIAHNGEINTVRGNLNWWQSKEKNLMSEIFSDEELELIKPICGDDLSDSGNFDNVLEYLVMSGYSLPHALMMMIPEAWEHDDTMEDYKKAFYEYHKTIMEPWDGPASICFTNGILVGATLDRNGLRPSRYCLMEDNTLIVASEAGA